MKKTMLIFLVICFFVFLFAQKEAKVVIYEDGFQGVLTSSGDVFDQKKFTAAHETLPLGTEVGILNILNGKKVQVIINDKLNNAPDLFWISKAAAQELDITSVSPTNILYTIIGDLPEAEPTELYKTLFASLGENLESPEGDPQIPRSTDENATAYGVQIYAGEKRMDAVTLSRRIQEEMDYLSYFERVKVNGEFLYRVIIGDFTTIEEALDCYWKVRADIPDIFLIEIY